VSCGGRGGSGLGESKMMMAEGWRSKGGGRGDNNREPFFSR
jgi:hypothetical protein